LARQQIPDVCKKRPTHTYLVASNPTQEQIMGTSKRIGSGTVLLAASITTALASPGFGQGARWTGLSTANDNWSSSTNWYLFNGPGTDTNDTVEFTSGSPRLLPNVDVNYNLSEVLFSDAFGSASTFTVGGTGIVGLTLGITNQMTSQQIFNPRIRLDDNIRIRAVDGERNIGNLSLGGRIMLNSHTMRVQPKNTVFFNGEIFDDGDIEMEGPGRMVLGATNTFTGEIVIRGGTVEFGFGGALGSINNAIVLWSDTPGSATLRRTTTGGIGIPVLIRSNGGAIDVPAGLTTTLLQGVQSQFSVPSSQFIKNGPGTLVLQNTLSYQGTTSVLGGRVRAESPLPTGPIVLAPATALELVGVNQVTSMLNSTGLVDILGTNQTFTIGTQVGSGDGSGNVFGEIRGVGARLIKQGVGTLLLAFPNTYSGGTDIRSGTLLVNNTTGSGTGSGQVTVQAGGTLSGNGIISGPVVVQSGGTIRPGNPGRSILVNNITLETGSTVSTRIGGKTVADIAELDILGTLTMQPGVVLSLSLLNNYQPDLLDNHLIVESPTPIVPFGSVTGMTYANPDDLRLAAIYSFANGTHRVNIAAARVADADLDKFVTFADLLILAQNYGTSGTKTWTNGDFDGDGVTGFSDLLDLAQRYQPESFTSDWATARAMVPEPATLSLLLGAGLLLVRRR
jgi:autotransporter-associated beta strand protein